MHLNPRAALASLAFALASSALPAAADPPPSDLPPLPTGPGTAGTAPALPPGAPPPPTIPYAPFTPPSLPTQPAMTQRPRYVPIYPYVPEVRGEPKLPPPPPRRYESPGLFAGGVTAVTVGLSTVLLGSYFVASATGRIEIYCDTPSFPCAYKTDAQRLTAGAIMMAGGTALGIAGIPMWFLGSRYVVVADDKKAARRDLPVDVRIGAGTASVSLRF